MYVNLPVFNKGMKSTFLDEIWLDVDKSDYHRGSFRIHNFGQFRFLQERVRTQRKWYYWVEHQEWRHDSDK